jgi:hypothetical protein
LNDEPTREASAAEIIRAVAELRYPHDAGARAQFCARHDSVIHAASGKPSPNPVTVVITPEEDERIWMLFYARHLVELAEAEFAKAPPPEPQRFINPLTGEEEAPPADYQPPTAAEAIEAERARVASDLRVWPYGRAELFPTLPEFDEELDDRESFQWDVSYIHAADLLDRGKRALDMLAIVEWDQARVILLRARVVELEIEKRWLQIREREARDKFPPGRKQGAVGELGGHVVEILRSDVNMSAADVRAALRRRVFRCGGAGDDERFFLSPNHRGTKWASIEARLPWYRALVRRQQGQQRQQPVK